MKAERGNNGTLRGWGRFLTVLLLVPLGRGEAGPPAPDVAPSSLDALLARLAQRGALYGKAATGFGCEETVRVGRFQGKNGEDVKEVKTLYDYLVEGNSSSGYHEIRLLVAKNDSPKGRRLVELDLNVPGAYIWSLLFTERHRPYFRFEAAGEEMLGLRLADVIAFSGGATFILGKQIEEWSGRVWVDRETGNFLKVEAAPNQQEELLPLRMTAWLQAPRFGAIPMKRRPRGYRYDLSFTVEKFSLTFPGEAETRVFALSPAGEEEIRERISQQFRNYVFFNVRSAEEFLGPR